MKKWCVTGEKCYNKPFWKDKSPKINSQKGNTVSGQIYISGGVLKRMKIRSVAGTDVRPTLSMVREALFDILSFKVSGASFLDLFAGNGTVAIEPLSRGAERVKMVERLPAALSAIKYNLSKVPENLALKAKVEAEDVKTFIKKGNIGDRDKFDIIFLDPPYYKTDKLKNFAAGLVEDIFSSGFCKETGIVVFQHETGLSLPEKGNNFEKTRIKKYGRTELTFFKPCEK